MIDPLTLTEEGIWYDASSDLLEVRAPLSLATQPNGDWKVYQHLGGRRRFKEAISPRVNEVVQLLEKLRRTACPIEPMCKLCPGLWVDYEDHLGGPKHWQKLEKRLVNGVPIQHLKEEFWNEWPIRHGWLRFNELTGVVEIRKGEAMPGATAPASRCDAPGRQASEGAAWEVIAAPLSLPSNRDGDWHSYTHLSSKRQFSESMKPRALQMEDILNGRADPWCRVCGNYQRFSEHIPGPAHFKMLTDNYIKDRVRVADVREDLWNEYQLKEEIYRFNELDGSIERMPRWSTRMVHGHQNISAWSPPFVAPPFVAQPLPPATPSEAPTAAPSAAPRAAPSAAPRAPEIPVQLPQRDDDTVSLWSTTPLPGTFAAMGAQPDLSQAQPDPDPGSDAAAKAAWEFWWRRIVATDRKVGEVHRRLCRWRPEEKLRCEGCLQTVTFGTFAQHLRSQQHFRGLMRRALDESNQDVQLQPLRQSFVTDGGEVVLEHTCMSLAEEI